MSAKKSEADPETPAAVHFTETSEFQEAVRIASEAAVSAAKAAMLGEVGRLMESKREAEGAGAVDGDQMSFARQMAMAIAEISDQNNNVKRTPPAEMALRAHARAQMDAAIIKYRRMAEDYRTTTGSEEAGPDAPVYLMVGKAYLGDSLIDAFRVDEATKKPYPVEIMYIGPPNEAMRPLNEAAKEIYGFFKRSLGDDPSDAPEPPGAAWISVGGNVIQGMHGTPVTMSEKRPAPNPIDLYQRGPGQFDPRRDRINILGTVAEPARHVAAPGEAPRKGI